MHVKQYVKSVRIFSAARKLLKQSLYDVSLSISEETPVSV